MEIVSKKYEDIGVSVSDEGAIRITQGSRDIVVLDSEDVSALVSALMRSRRSSISIKNRIVEKKMDEILDKLDDEQLFVGINRVEEISDEDLEYTNDKFRQKGAK